MNEKKKIEVQKLYLIFGRERNKAFKMLMKGKCKQDIVSVFTTDYYSIFYR